MRGTPRIPSACPSLPLLSGLHAAPGDWTAVTMNIRACKVGITLHVFIYRTKCDLTFDLVEDEGDVVFYKNAIRMPMAVLPASPFISRASYPTLVPPSLASNMF